MVEASSRGSHRREEVALNVFVDGVASSPGRAFGKVEPQRHGDRREGIKTLRISETRSESRFQAEQSLTDFRNHEIHEIARKCLVGRGGPPRLCVMPTSGSDHGTVILRLDRIIVTSVALARRGGQDQRSLVALCLVPYFGLYVHSKICLSSSDATCFHPLDLVAVCSSHRLRHPSSQH